MWVQATDHPLSSWKLAGLETALILLVFFLYAGWPPPAVNEAHYLAKAKHYWNPAWCSGDIFLESANVHLAFYWALGWLTRFISLASTAWIGRWVSWGLLAVAWQRLHANLVPRPFLSVLTSAVFLVLVHYAHLSGEWVVGGVEAKTFAYPFLVFGLANWVKGNWRTSFVFLGLASAFHVLVGGWSCMALLVSLMTSSEDRPRLLTLLPWGIIAGVLAIPGVVPPLAANWGQPAEIVSEANRLYVYERLSHHLIFHRFPHSFMLRHGLLVVVWGIMAYRWPVTSELRRLRAFVTVIILIAGAGIVVDQSTLYAPQFAAALLKYYWFRMTDVTTPLGVAMGVGVVYDRLRRERPLRAEWLLVLTLIGVTAGMLNHIWPRLRDPRPAGITVLEPGDGTDELVGQASYRDWLLVCRWMEGHTRPHDVVFTPRQQQTFKWYAGRAEFFSWKDMPQDALSLTRWWKRREASWYARYASYLPDDPGSDEALDQLLRAGVRYWVMQQPEQASHPRFVRIYPTRFEPNSTYSVYLLRAGTQQSAGVK